MAFEAFLAQSKSGPRGGRWLALIASGVGHTVLVLGAAAFFLPPAVKAVFPTLVPVTLRLPFAPKPAAPAPAARTEPAQPERPAPAVASTPAPVRPARRRVRAPAPQVAPAPAREAAPPEITQPAAADTAAAVPAVSQPVPPPSPPAAAAPGAPGPPSVASAVATPARRPRFLPEALGASQKLSGDLPRLPASLARTGTSYTVLARVCVAETGRVSSVSIERAAHPALDDHVASVLAGWRYRPLMAANLPIPFCTFVRFEFRSL